MGKTKKWLSKPQDETSSNQDTTPRQDFGSNVAQQQQVPQPQSQEPKSVLQLAQQETQAKVPPELPTRPHGPAPVKNSKGQWPPAYPASPHPEKPEGAKSKVPPPLPTRPHGPAPVKNKQSQWPPAYPAQPHPEKPQAVPVQEPVKVGEPKAEKKPPIEIIVPEEQAKQEQQKEVEEQKKVEEQKPVEPSEEEVAEQVAEPEKKSGKKKKGFFDWLASPFKKVGKAMKGLFSGFSSKSESESEDIVPPKKAKAGPQPQFDWKDFKVLGKLGQGGSKALVFSLSYLSKEWDDKIKVAGKLFQTGSGADDKKSKAEASRREIDMMKQLPESENLLQYAGVTDRLKGQPMLLMELAEKGDMKKVFKAVEDSGLPEQKQMLLVRYLMRGSFRGLRDLHAADIVHGDVKDENVFLDADLTPKLSDFGNSRTTKQLEEDEKDETKGTGTGPYMAPEVLTDPITKESDIWSMGETLLRGTEKGLDTVDIHKGQKAKDYNKEIFRAYSMKDDSWMDKLAETSTKKGTKEFASYLSFVEGTMARDPKKRMTAEKALDHQFLKLDDKDEAEAKKALGDLLPKG